MTTTMRALYQNAYGDISTFQVSHLPLPVPTSDQILIRVHAAALNPIDLLRGRTQVPDEELPVIIGYDVAGVVEKVGASVTSFKPGDRVFGDIQENSTGPKTSGSVAQYCVSNPDMLTLIPEDVSFVDAAALPVAACTAIQGFQKAGAKEGDNIFISGGAGGVGIHAIQIARTLFGAKQVATTASAAKLGFVSMYGADTVVDYKNDDAGKVLEGWADVVLDCTKEIDMAKRIVKQGGKIVSIAEFGVSDIISFALKPGKELMEKTASLLASGKLTPVIGCMYSLDEAVKAVEHVGSGSAKGKIVVKVRDN